MFWTVILIATLVATGVLLGEEAVVRRLRLDRLAGYLRPQQFVVGVAALIVGLIALYHGLRAVFWIGFGFDALLELAAAATLIGASMIIAPKFWRRVADKTQSVASVHGATGWAAARADLIGLLCLILAAVILIRAL